MSETEMDFLTRCKQILAERGDKETLAAVLQTTADKDIYNAHTLAWTVLSKLRYPMANLTPNGPAPITLLDIPYNEHPYEVPEEVDKEADLEDYAQELEGLVQEQTPEASVYMHLASIRFGQDNSQKAQRILRQGMECAEDSTTITLYYCDNLNRARQNVARFEELLWPVLHDRELAAVVHNYAREQLISLYLELGDYRAAAGLLNAYPLGREPDSLLEALTVYCLAEDGELRPEPHALSDWLARETVSFFDKAPEYLTPETDNLVDYRPEMVVPVLCDAWRQSPDVFTQTVLSMEEQNSTWLEISSDFTNLPNLSRLFTDLAHPVGENTTLWQFLAVVALPVESAIPTDMRDFIAPLYWVYPCLTTRLHHMRWVAYWHDRSEGNVDFPQELYQTTLMVAENHESELREPWVYEYLTILNPAPKRRPFPYWANEVAQGIQANDYPQPFIVGLWNCLVRDAALAYPQEMAGLIDVFDEKIPNSDPLFIIGYHQYDHDLEAAATTYRRLIEAGFKPFSVYRNLSLACQHLGNIEEALQCEQLIASDPDIATPDNSAERIEALEQALKDLAAREEALKGVECYYAPFGYNLIDVASESLTDTLRLMALVEGFIDWQSYAAQPIAAGDIPWLSVNQDLIATQWLKEGRVYASNETVGEGITIESDGARIPNYTKMTLLPNMEPKENWHGQLAILEKRLEDLREEMSPEAIEDEIRTLLVEDLIAYALSRFEAYDIPVHEAARVEQSATECLELFPLAVCYGIFYHEIEDAAGKQREDHMSNQHTVNYGLSCARSKAKRANEDNWNLKPYDRERSAGPEAKIVSIIATHFPALVNMEASAGGSKRGL
jgi:hypothetical protein